MLRKKEPESSEIGTSGYSPNVWKRIREKNQRLEREANPLYEPVVSEPPRAWLCRMLIFMVTFWMFFG